MSVKGTACKILDPSLEEKNFQKIAIMLDLISTW